MWRTRRPENVRSHLGCLALQMYLLPLYATLDLLLVACCCVALYVATHCCYVFIRNDYTRTRSL